MTIVSNITLSSSGQFFDKVKVDADEVVVMATLKARELETDFDDSKRKPIDVVVVLDVSGSMGDAVKNGKSKLDLCKDTLKYLIFDVLSSKDRLSLVTFTDDAKCMFKLQNMTNDNKQYAMAKVNSLRPLNSTNLSAGLFMGIDELKQTKEPNEVQTILLLTDGLMNRGEVDKAKLCRMLTDALSAQKKRTSVSSLSDMMKSLSTSFAGKPAENVTMSPSVFTFGYGMDVDTQALSDIANCSAGGSYFAIEDLERVPLAFSSCIAGVLSIAAHSLKLKVKVNDVFYVDDRFINFTKAERVSSSEIELRLKDLYFGEERDILFPVKLNKQNENKTVTVEFYLSFMDSTLEKMVETVSILNLERTTSEVTVNSEVVKHQLRLTTANIMEEARKRAEKGDVDGGKQVLHSQMAQVRSAQVNYGMQNDEFLSEMDNDLNEAYNGKLLNSGFMEVSQQAHRTQRSNKMWSGYEDGGVYATKAKKSALSSTAKAFGFGS